MVYAVGVIEIKSIAKGVEACDSALKSAGVRLISAHPSCPGKYEILLTGNLSDVQTALERVRSFYGSYIVDAVLMGRIDESVVKALMGAQTAVATGALDPIAEAEIYSKFDEIAGDKTAIYISHRLSSCKFCDEIAVFHEGAVIQQGSHAELLADRGGKYYALWNAQAQYYTE